MTKSPLAPGASWVCNYLMVKDVLKSADFYQKAFGLTLKEAPVNEKGVVEHAELVYKDYLIMIGQEGCHDKTMFSPATSGVKSPIILYLYVPDVDAFYKNALAHGAKTDYEPEDMFWGDRACGVVDLDGYSWCFGTHIGHREHHCSHC